MACGEQCRAKDKTAKRQQKLEKRGLKERLDKVRESSSAGQHEAPQPSAVLAARPKPKAGRIVPIFSAKPADPALWVENLDLLPRWPDLRKYRPSFEEAFALVKAFEDELQRTEYSRIFYDHDALPKTGTTGKFTVKHTPCNGGGGRQYYGDGPAAQDQLVRTMLNMEKVFESGIARWLDGLREGHDGGGKEGEVAKKQREKYITPDDMEEFIVDVYATYRDRMYDLLKEVQYVYAEKIVKEAKRQGYSHEPSAEEVEAALRPSKVFF